MTDDHLGTEAIRQKSVVRSDEELVPVGCGDGTPIETHSGIDDRQVHGTGREMGHRRPQDKRGFPDAVPRDAMADVHQMGLGRDTQQHTFHDADVGVIQTEVRGERDYHGDKITIAQAFDSVR